MIKGVLVLGAASGLVQAAEAPASYRELISLLQQELSLLASVEDAASAAAVAPELSQVLEALATMEQRGTKAGALWEYMDNTAGAKAPLIEILQRLAIQFQRLEKCRFWECAELRALLRPQLEETDPAA